MVYQPSKEKSWHKYNMTNSTSNLVAPTIDAQMGRTLQTTSARCEQIQGTQNNGVEPILARKRVRT